jgi:hypothetical protein
MRAILRLTGAAAERRGLDGRLVWGGSANDPRYSDKNLLLSESALEYSTQDELRAPR